MQKKMKYIIFEQSPGFLKGMEYKIRLYLQKCLVLEEQKMSLRYKTNFCYFVGFVIAVVLVSIYHSREDWRLLGEVKNV